MKTKLAMIGLVLIIIILGASLALGRGAAQEYGGQQREYKFVTYSTTEDTAFGGLGSGENEAVPECSNLDLRQTATALKNSGFATDYDAIVEVLNDSPKVSDYPQLLQDISQLQANWWSDLAPVLPNCAYANAIALAGGRMLDELTISTGIGLSVFDEIALKRSGDDLLLRAQYHIKQWMDYQDQLLALVADLTNMIEAS